MSLPADGATPSRAAWQPFTFGGLAAFARAGLGRLLLVELVVALLVSGSAVWFLRRACAPVVLQVIQELPETARITNGRLAGIDDTLIAQTKFLAIAVTPDTSGQIGQSADFQVQFRPTDFRIGSVFQPDWGWEFDYAPGATLNLGRSNLEPWWGAWHPILLAGAGLAVLVLLFGIWALLASIYTLPAKFFAWFMDRQLSWGGAWRMSAASLLPGAVLMGAALFLYSCQAVDLIGLAVVFAAHLLLGWVCLGGGAWACPRLHPDILKQNPFRP
jgi:hypothetical protein